MNYKIKINILVLLSFALFLLVLSSPAYSQNSNMKLLAVSELSNGTLIGQVASLHLDIRRGNGQVFIDTYPLSKFDTQLSIRFAEEVACKLAGADCRKTDFMYTIRADSEFIGGPSAGAAIAALTYAKLAGLSLDESIALTGTINAGRLIGNVGGVKEKIMGAKKYGLKKVLIPIGEAYDSEAGVLAANALNSSLPSLPDYINTTVANITALTQPTPLSLAEYGKSIGIEVIPVSDLEEAIFYLTGKDLRRNYTELLASSEYTGIMKNISDELCKRSQAIIGMINSTNFTVDGTIYNGEPINKTYYDGIALFNQSLAAALNSSYYSASSFCYGANVKLYYVYLISQGYSDEYYRERMHVLFKAISILSGNVTRSEYSTIASLQTAMIVRQRLDEADGYLDIVEAYFNKSRNDIQNATTKAAREKALYYTALTIERLKTSESWSRFFLLRGEAYQIQASALSASCKEIIADAKSRLQYARLYIPSAFGEQQTELNEENMQNDTLYCIAKASRIRAEIDAIISSFGLDKGEISALINRTLLKALEVISGEAKVGRFPILGYSYYEYAKSLRNSDQASALLYSEYALELSNLDVYMEISRPGSLGVPMDFSAFLQEKGQRIYTLILFISCVLLALLAGYILGVKRAQKFYKSRQAKYRLGRRR